jgi:hypothetical protein
LRSGDHAGVKTGERYGNAIKIIEENLKILGAPFGGKTVSCKPPQSTTTAPQTHHDLPP